MTIINNYNYIIFKILNNFIQELFFIHCFYFLPSRIARNLYINKKFLRETGITSTANYTYLFNDLSKMFTKSPEDATYVPENDIADKMMDILISRDLPFLKYFHIFRQVS